MTNSTQTKGQDAAASTKYAFKSYEGDPLKTRIYTLENGLKIYLTLNKNEPRIQTYVAVRAGSKMDPAETTGLAHYLEHMLFKGTHDIGTLDWEKENALLQQISDLYEKHRFTKDEEEKKKIYAEIDKLSFEASKYAIPNEYDKMITSLGAKGTNAYTSNEKTVYINDIPSNELERWLKIEANRFQTLVLRLFHTELETVYEEFNRGEDNDYRKSWKSLYAGLFPNHNYGKQTTIGEGAHIKNPSMENIHKYFSTYYVPNNMAICLSGDFDFDQTVELIDQYFGDWEAKEVPEFVYEPEKPIFEPSVFENYGMSGEHTYMGFRFPGAGSEEEMMIKLVNGLLSNGQAGLFDINIVQQQKLLDVASYAIGLKDYSMHIFFGVPREGQALESVTDTILAEIDKLKTGDFDDWLIDAVVRDMRYNQTKQFESNNNRAHYLVDAFILDVDFQEWFTKMDRMAKVSKQDVMDFVKKHYNGNYAVAYKRHGEDKQVHKVEKPPITPVQINRDVKSKFFQEFSNMPSGKMEPVFLDYDEKIKQAQIKEQVPFYYIHNKENQNFNLYYILDMGNDHDRQLGLAIRYLPFLGTSKYTPEEFQKELFKLGCSFNVNTARKRSYITLSGLDESFEKGVELFEHLLEDVQPNQDAYNDLVEAILKERSDRKLNKGTILNRAMLNYGRYGAHTPFNDTRSEKELREADINDLVSTIKSLSSFEHKVFYYGSQEQKGIEAVLDNLHKVPATLKPYPEPRTYELKPQIENEVYFVHYDQKQVEIMLLSNDTTYNFDLVSPAHIFNEYFGAGLSSIVFQEIREAKALAYSAYSFFVSPGRQDDHHYLRAYIGTQSDKLGEAVEALLGLMNDLPRVDNQYDSAKGAALKKIESERISKAKIFWSYQRTKDLGMDHDYRKEVYKQIQELDFEALQSFFNEHIKGKNFSYMVIGDRDSVDMETLKELGTLKELTLEEIFGY